MTKRKTRERKQRIFERLVQTSARSNQDPHIAQTIFDLGKKWSRAGTKMKKFRFQLLHHWLVERFEPCHVADIGGGKGLLTRLLLDSGWQAAVIDPVSQALPGKYKDLSTGKRVRVDDREDVPRIDAYFEPDMAREFDLLIGMHAHGCNAKIIDAAARFGCGFVLFPCCVIDEPFYPRLGVHWLESLLDYALDRGHTVYPFRLKFKGQNIGFCAPGRCAFRQGVAHGG